MNKKFYIKQYVLQNNSFQDWYNDNYRDFQNVSIIGYIFTTKKPIKFGQAIKVLNLYLLKDAAPDEKISAKTLYEAWELFFVKFNENPEKHITVFENPPVERWLDTKNNWCKKIANQVALTFNRDFDEALSEVYITIMICYGKGTIYMGNLNYLRKAIYNSVLMDIRYNRKRLNGNSGLVVSINEVVGASDEDEDLILEDIIAAEEVQTEDSLEYKMLLENIKTLLRPTFSDREIDQIITYQPSYLPISLYRRLLRWREQHSVEELYE